MDIVQLIGERVQLRKAGRAYKGLCPFHGEKTPSFTVDPDRRTYKCFGCQEGGDVFTWLQKMDGLEPVEALNQLAERAGMELQRRAPEARDYEKRLLSAHDTALFYFRQAWRGTDAGKAAAAYVNERGIDQQTIERFGLGFAPDLMDGLLSYLRKKGFTDDESVTAGLIARTERGVFDRFRHRVMIPIRDSRGKVIAFAGRALRANQPAKYVNSPQTPLFNKSATLFGLDLARPAIRKTGEVVIVEGQFDTISCHQAGFDNVVASMGTALTEDQYRILAGLKIGRAVVAFDADPAGQRSAEKRGRELARLVQRWRGGGVISTSTGLDVYVASLESGDPDQLARTQPERLRALLADARPILQFLIDEIASRFDLGGPDGRRRYLAETLPLLADEPDAVTKELYLGVLSKKTGVDQETLRAQASASRTPEARRAPGLPRPEVQPDSGPSMKQTSSAERYLMAELTQFPEEAARIDLAPEDFQDSDHRAIFEHFRSGGHPNAGLPAHLAAIVAAFGALAPEHEVAADPGRALEIAALRLREQNLRRRLGDARAALVRAGDREVGDAADEVARLAEELERVMRARESATVLRAEMETE